LPVNNAAIRQPGSYTFCIAAFIFYQSIKIKMHHTFLLGDQIKKPVLPYEDLALWLATFI
jgi:hypothetical protein